MITNKSIELELRAEIPISSLDTLIENMKKRGNLSAHSRRLSVMFLGKTAKVDIDIRIRINDMGVAELVIKKGDLHAHDRVEFSESLTKGQVIGIVRALSLLDFSSKVTERENFVYDLDEEISFVIVKAGTIAYVEIEKMSHADEVESNKEKLLAILDELELPVIKSKEQFDELCSRLSELSDWKFNATKEDFDRLQKQLERYS